MGWARHGGVRGGAGEAGACALALAPATGSAWITPQLAAGSSHSAALRADGTLWAWGDNYNGQIGDGTRLEKPVPVQVGAPRWAALSAGYTHTAAIEPNGTLWAWGDNLSGQLGIGTTADQLAPVQVGTDTNWMQVRCGNGFTLALKTDGSLWAWGKNDFGQLGLGTTSTTQLVPARVGTATDWVDVAAARTHALALRSDGSVWAWGRNLQGELGIDNAVQQDSPVAVLAPAGRFVAVGGGAFHSVALRDDGTLWAWGVNNLGQLGDGTALTRWTAVRVGTDADWTALAVGGHHTLALKGNGSLWAWGQNESGQLGDGTQTLRRQPYLVDDSTTWAAVAAGLSHSLAMAADGTLLAFGHNGYNQLGLGTNGVTRAPVLVGTAPNWHTMAAGYYHSLGIRTDGTYAAWGYNYHGQLGDTTNDMGWAPAPMQVAAAGPPLTAAGVSGGTYHSVLLRADGTLWASGQNDYGQLGVVTATPRQYTPVPVAPGTAWRAVAAGYHHTVAIRSDGTLWSWGWNAYGQLGDGTTTDHTLPAQVGSEANWASVSAGYTFTLALKTDGSLWAWGSNLYGQLGDGTTTAKLVPTRIGQATSWAKIAPGAYHAHAIRTDGTLWAWGENGQGRLGLGSTTDQLAPVQVGTETTWASVAGGHMHTLATKADGSLWGWGDNSRGSVGDGSTALKRTAPVRLGTGTQWVRVAAAGFHSLAIQSDGSLYAWGLGCYGQLGDGIDREVEAPEAPSGLRLLEDTDADGLDDFWEMEFFGDLAQSGSGDADGDGVSNAEEFARRTVPSLPDTDGDGVRGHKDHCPNTAAGATVDVWGCDVADDDGDGVKNDDDNCAATPAGMSPHADGCAPAELDDDGDGVMNHVDKCPLTMDVTDLDPVTGCSPDDGLDQDGDGIANFKDRCPGTPAGDPVDTLGCTKTPHLSAVSLSPDEIQQGRNRGIIVSTKAFRVAEAITSVVLERVSADGSEVLETIGPMLDDGVLPDYDAANGIYTATMIANIADDLPRYYRARAMLANGGDLLSDISALQAGRFPVRGNPEIDWIHALVGGEWTSYARDVIVVTFAPSVTEERVAQIAQEQGATIINSSVAGHWYYFRYPYGTCGDTLFGHEARAAVLRRYPETASVGPVHGMAPASATDPAQMCPHEGPLPSATCQPSNVVHEMVGLEHAAILERGENIQSRIAIIDTGVDVDHDDLGDLFAGLRIPVADPVTGQIAWHDARSVAFDVDGEPYDGLDDDEFEPDGHGTPVAGTLGAIANNRTGITGGARSLLRGSLIAFNARGHGKTKNIIPDNIRLSLELAAQMNVKLVNLSVEMSATRLAAPVDTWTEILEFAKQNDLLIVAAVGNKPRPDPTWPCALNSGPNPVAPDNLVCVGGVDQDFTRWEGTSPNQGSSFGAWVEIAAPAWARPALGRTNATTSFGGTSAAAPLVTAAAALVLSKNPNWSAGEIKRRLLDTATPLDSNEQVGNLLNAARAVADFELELATPTHIRHSLRYEVFPTDSLTHPVPAPPQTIVFPATITLYRSHGSYGVQQVSDPVVLTTPQDTLRGNLEWPTGITYDQPVSPYTYFGVLEDAAGNRAVANVPVDLRIVPLASWNSSFRTGFTAGTRTHPYDQGSLTTVDLLPGSYSKMQIYGYDAAGAPHLVDEQLGPNANIWNKGVLPYYTRYLIRVYGRPTGPSSVPRKDFVAEQEVVYLEEHFSSATLLGVDAYRKTWLTADGNEVSIVDSHRNFGPGRDVIKVSTIGSGLSHWLTVTADGNGICATQRYLADEEDPLVLGQSWPWKYSGDDLVPASGFGLATTAIRLDPPLMLHSTPSVQFGWQWTILGSTTDLNGDPVAVVNVGNRVPRDVAARYILIPQRVSVACSNTPLTSSSASTSAGSLFLQLLE